MTTALLVGGDLMAMSRLESAAAHSGAAVVAVPFGRLADGVEEHVPDVVVLDLDGGREPVLEELAEARRRGAVPARVVGYLSHVDGALAEAARRAGCEPIPRGRFWRTLPELLAEPG